MPSSDRRTVKPESFFYHNLDAYNYLRELRQATAVRREILERIYRDYYGWAEPAGPALE